MKMIPSNKNIAAHAEAEGNHEANTNAPKKLIQTAALLSRGELSDLREILVYQQSSVAENTLQLIEARIAGRDCDQDFLFSVFLVDQFQPA